MSNLKQILCDEIPAFKETSTKFINKEVSKMDYKKYSGGYGVYAHRDGENLMIRLRIPSGITSIKDLRTIYNMAKKYDLDTIRLTTRQAIQLHGLNVEQICETVETGLKKNIYTRGSGGNYPRNIAMSPLSGVDPEEAFDITPYAIAANKYFLRKIYTYKLPRKLKISFSSSYNDDGNATVQDLGFIAVKKDGIEYFKVFVAGGLGRNPRKAIELDELIKPSEVLYYIEALVRLFSKEGDFENPSQARVRYFVSKFGEEEFIAKYKKYVRDVKRSTRISVKFNPIDYSKAGIETNTIHPRLFKQKQDGLYSVYFQPIGGNLKIADLKKILDNLKDVENHFIRLSMNTGMYFINLNGEEADALLKLTSNLGAETNIEKGVSCIGVPTCQMGLLESQKALNNVIKYFKSKNMDMNVLPTFHISGCHNSCSAHQSAKIGFAGKKKRVNDAGANVFEVYLNGTTALPNPNLGEYLGDVLEDKVSEFLYDLASDILESKLSFDEYSKNYKDKLDKVFEKYSV